MTWRKHLPSVAARVLRIIALICTLAWMGTFMIRAQQQRHSIPEPITIEAFRLQTLEDRAQLLENSRFEFSSEIAAIRVSIEELTKTQDATRSILIGMCAPLLGLFVEMFIRLFKDRQT
jgi:hypothetical protein